MLPAHIVERMHPGQLLQHYLMASYCYYILHQSPMADSVFDRICMRLLAAFDGLEHQHKHLVSRDDLEAGTGYALSEDKYPRMVMLAALEYYELCRSGEIVTRIEPHLMPVSTSVRRISRRPPPAQVIPAPAAPVAVRVSRRPPPRPAPVATPAPAPAAPAVRRVRRVPR